MSESTKRSKNFSPFERTLLIDLVLQRKEVIENKKADGTILAEKKQSWEDLCKVFNASSQTGDRTAKQLKELYFVMKRNARKHNNKDRIGYSVTGGGTHDPKSDQIDLKIVAALKDQFEPDRNPFDSSTILFDNSVPVLEGMNTLEASCSDHIIETVAADDAINVEPVIEGNDNVEVVVQNDVLSTPSHPKSALKRKSNYLQSVSESIVNRKKAKTDLDEELTVIKKTELEMKKIQHNKKCEILDIQKKIALKELEKQDYELKITELEYKIKLKQFEMM